MSKKIRKIAIAGQGGLGSHLARLLYDFGVNREQFDFAGMQIDIFDNKCVSVKNLLHQNFTEDDLGKKKVDIMAEHYALTPHYRYMLPEDIIEYDVIFSCVDSMSFRWELYNWWWNNPAHSSAKFFIDGRCNSRQGAVFNSSLGREKLEKFISDSDEVGGCLLQYEKDNNISHSMPIIVSAMMIQVFLNFVRGVTSQPEKVFLI